MLVYIMRGLPGSGKSKWVREHMSNPFSIVVSTDDYHKDMDGVYRFKPDKIAEYHNRAYKEVVQQCLMPSHEVLFVDNTNISIWELAPYYRIAEAYGHTVKIIQCECHFEEAVKRQGHGVPIETMHRMLYRYQRAEIPPFWNVETVWTGE